MTLRERYVEWSEDFFTKAAYSLNKPGPLRAELADLHARLGSLLSREVRLKTRWARCAERAASSCEVCRDPDARGHPRYLYAWVPKGAGGGGKYVLVKENDSQREARLEVWAREYLVERARLSMDELARLQAEGSLDAGLTPEDIQRARESVLAAIHG